ncbi:MAG TPA: hypothetical protein VGN24_08605 [Rhodanobacter sp.]|jgi:hypothetical protein|nr:hypothetical protein [Rhodanobacter sp.]
MKPVSFRTLALFLLLPLAACGQAPQDAGRSSATDHPAQAARGTDQAPATSMIAGEVQKAMQKAKLELASKNINVDSVHFGDSRNHGRDSLPKAEITPQGDLLIAGTKVAATPAQHALLVDYRAQIVSIAEAGMDIGTQGADLGIHAAKAAIWGALSGKNDKAIEASIKPQTDKIQAAALKLCKRLPELLSSQQNLAAAMPEFRPYARMEQKDVDDCGKDMADKDGKQGFAVFSD